jgi:hypothetical protein
VACGFPQPLKVEAGAGGGAHSDVENAKRQGLRDMRDSGIFGSIRERHLEHIDFPDAQRAVAFARSGGSANRLLDGITEGELGLVTCGQSLNGLSVLAVQNGTGTIAFG